MKLTAAIPLLLLLSQNSYGEQDNCTDFRWVTDFDGTEKAAMVITAEVNGSKIDLQFDTGSDVSAFYGDDLPAKLGLSIEQQHNGRRTASTTLQIEGLALKTQPFHILPYPPAQVAGRLGLKALLGHIVQIDYPNQKICLLSKLQYRLARPKLQQVAARIRSNKFFLQTVVNNKQGFDLFFDTGASIYPMLVDKQQWQQLTRRRGDEADNIHIQGWANSDLVTTVGAPLQGTVKFGEFEIVAPLVHYTRERPSYFANHLIRTNGLIGNAPFFDQVVILDLREKRTWFGIVRQ